MSLNLYAKVEDLLGIEEATVALHDLYLQHLSNYHVKRFLDIGCGRGGLLEVAAAQQIEGYGIDLSDEMIAAAQAKGLQAECRDVCDVEGSFDAAVAVFDVLNFLDAKDLERFLTCVSRLLKPGGVFLADINTLHGFTNVAEGTMMAEDETRFLGIEAIFSNQELHTTFTLFEHQSDGHYMKEQETIVQHFHPIKRFRQCKELKLVEQHGISLYDNEDKTLLVMKKPTV